MAQLQLQTTGATLIQNSAIQTIPNVQRESSWIYDTINLINKINNIYLEIKRKNDSVFQLISVSYLYISPVFVFLLCWLHWRKGQSYLFNKSLPQHYMTHTALSYNNVLNFNPYLNIRYFIFQINYLDYHKIHLNDKQ